MSCPWGTAADTCPAGKLPHASCRDSQLDSLKTRSAEHPHEAPVLCELSVCLRISCKPWTRMGRPSRSSDKQACDPGPAPAESPYIAKVRVHRDMERTTD